MKENTIHTGIDLYGYDREFTLKQALRLFESLGYVIDKNDTFIYYREGQRVKAFNLVEKDTGIGFANIAARKDENWKKLLNWRFWATCKSKDGKTEYQF